MNFLYLLFITFLFNFKFCFAQQKISDKKDTIYLSDSYDNFKPSSVNNHNTVTLSDSGKIALGKLNYVEISKIADSFFLLAKYNLSAKLFLYAFQKNNDMGQVIHRYRTAICHAELNDADAAFIQLFRIAEKGNYYNYFEIRKENAFSKLYSDKRWDSLMKIIEANALEIGDRYKQEMIQKEQ
jgi:hypothetical protein